MSERRPSGRRELPDALVNLADYEVRAKACLPPEIYDYFAGGAGDEVTIRDNRDAYDRIKLIHRVLRDVSERDLSTTLLGHSVALPIVCAPTAFHRLACDEGELATARAAADSGTSMILSMASTVALEDVAAAIGDARPPLWAQLYIQRDHEFTLDYVRRAEAVGVAALVVTVDSPVFGRRERDIRSQFHDLPEGLSLANFAGDSVASIDFRPELSWSEIDWLRSSTELPILLKGIVHPDDARKAVEHGACGVIVSNHGGRQLDTAAATIDVLGDVAAAVGDTATVLVDGGIRRGTDVVKALALGADAVAVGRPLLWGLAVAGQEGARNVLEMLRAELDAALALCGCSSPADVKKQLVRTFDQRSVLGPRLGRLG